MPVNVRKFIPFRGTGTSLLKMIMSLLVIAGLSFSGKTQSFDFISYGPKEGLSQTEVTTLMQDSRGYLWVGTAGGGVCKFDGIEFEEYNESHGLGGNIVQSVTEDVTGKIWVGTSFGGVTCLDGKKAVSYSAKDGMPGSSVISLASHNDEVWIGTDKGLAVWSSLTEKITKVKTLPYSISAIHNGSDNTVWVGSEGAVYRMTDKIPVRLDIPFLNNVRRVNKISDDGQGLLYIATTEGLFIWNISTGTNAVTPVTAALRGKEVKCALPISDNYIWVALEEYKLLKFKTDGTVKDYTIGGSIDNSIVNSIFQDNSGLIWFGTLTSGLIKFRSEAFNYFPDIPGLKRNDVYHFAEDGAGKIYVATGKDGVYSYDGKTVTKIAGKLERVTCLLFDRQKRLWIAHGNGVALSNGTTIMKQFLEGTRARWLMEDKKGNIWIGTWEKGLYKYDGKSFQNFTVDDGLPMNYVHAIKEDHNGIIWIGTGSGLTRYNGEKFTTYSAELCNTYVGSIVEDQHGAIWFNTDRCVMRYDGVSFTAYDQKDGLRSNTIYLIQLDTEGDLWVGTNKGVDRMKVDKKGRVLSVKNYGLNEGFRGIECNSRAAMCDSNGYLWFGTVEGVIRYNKLKDKQNNSQANVNITDIRLFLEPTNWQWKGVSEKGWFHLPDSIILPHDQNHLTFYFRGIDLTSPKNVSYKFMLQGFDSTWSPLIQKNDITYANLAPGVYKFLVKAVTNDGVWNTVPASSCNIRILGMPTPFYTSNWFILFLFIMAVAGIYLLITIRTRRIRVQKEELEILVQKRTQEITRQNEEKTVMLKEIHHRVKNNLQIISSLLNLQSENITDPKVLNLFDECRQRISSIALIHEKMYQSKNLVNINIKEYIADLIRSLIDVYKLDKRIRLRTEIEDHAFSIDTLVPVGLILSEAISNAMKYAFVGREEGQIYITLRKTSGFYYELIIADNGVGMPHNLDVKSAKSLGLQLIHLLADQVDGRIALEPADGTRWVLIFKG